jgi:hypothetical protein
MSIIAAAIMSHPLLAVVNVRSVGMSFPIVKLPVLLDGSRILHSRRAMRRNVLTTASDFGPAAALMASTLCHR